MTYYYPCEVETRILGGLPVTIGYEIEAADDSVGMGESLHWAIIGIAGRYLRKNEKTDWLTKRLTKYDIAAIEQTCYDAAREAAEDAAVERGMREREYY